MKSIHIGDVHHKIEIAEHICSKHPDNLIVFHGDYFDDYGDDVEKTKLTADWLVKSLQNPKRVHLWGNHDIQYFHRLSDLTCSGFDQEKYEAIRNHPIWELQDKFQLAAEVNGFLCTHAGLNPEFLPPTGWSYEWFVSKIGEVFVYLTSRRVHWLLGVGYARMGFQKIGGITWQDWTQEFQPIPGVNQICGHTRNAANSVRKKEGENSVNYCIDTELKKYLEVTDGVATIRSVK